MATFRLIMNGSKTQIKNATEFSIFNAAALLLHPTPFL